jgi:hypothetical protein
MDKVFANQITFNSSLFYFSVATHAKYRLFANYFSDYNFHSQSIVNKNCKASASIQFQFTAYYLSEQEACERS